MKGFLYAAVSAASMLLVSAAASASGGATPGNFDTKSISAYGCFPQTGKQQADFYYGTGAIINKTRFDRNVICTIFRDKFTRTSSDTQEVKEIEIHFFRDFRANNSPIACQSFIRDLNTGDVLDTDVRRSFTTGPGKLTMPSLNYFSEYDIIYMFCKLPAYSKLKGLRWSETDERRSGYGTDGEPGIGS